jgi:hypothetical protein
MVVEEWQGTTILTGHPLSFTIFDFQEIPIQNVFTCLILHTIIRQPLIFQMIWVHMVIKIAIITLEKAK